MNIFGLSFILFTLPYQVALIEERNTLLCPPPGSGVPGATIDWIPRDGMEKHIPVVFMDVDGGGSGGMAGSFE